MLYRVHVCSRFTTSEQVRAEVEAHLLSWERRAVEGKTFPTFAGRMLYLF